MMPLLAACVLAVPALGLGGCLAAGWLADGVVDPAHTVRVEPEYLGLENQRVAVLVDTDIDIAMAHPLAQLEVASVISDRIADNVPGATVRDAEQIARFQQRNLYWTTARYADLMERLEVDRLVIIELVDYHLHEPGNVNIWRGLITANIGVAEADGDNPNNLVYASTVSVTYPPESEVGLLNANQRTIRLATLDSFSRAAAGKFYQHDVRRNQ